MTQSIDQDVQLSPHIMDVYGYFFRPEKRRKDRKQVERASPPSVTTNAITHALISPYPHARCVFVRRLTRAGLSRFSIYVIDM